MKSINVTNLLVYFGVLLFPFQFLAVRFFTGAYDIASLLLISNILLVIISGMYINKKVLIIISSFIIIQCIIVIYFNIGPSYRFISGIIWLSALLLIIVNGNHNHHYSQKLVFKLIFLILSFSAIYMWFEYYFIITPGVYSYDWSFLNRFNTKRPMAGFSEPSYAALALFAAAAASFSSLMFSKNSKKMYFKLIAFSLLLCSAAFLARSMHVVTFIISIGIVICIWLSYRISIIKIFLFFTIIACLLALMLILLSYSHYYQRVNIFADPAGMENPSLLSWLRGFDQVMHVMRSSPYFGFGIGSTGYFEFDSLYGDRLAYYRLYELTLRDAFSLLWRLLIEIGLVPVSLFAFYMINRLYYFRKLIINASYNDKNLKYIIFNFTFALTLIIGCLIKEPNYARSSLFIGIFLISSIPLALKNKY